jgi:hypothetical protein
MAGVRSSLSSATGQRSVGGNWRRVVGLLAGGFLAGIACSTALSGSPGPSARPAASGDVPVVDGTENAGTTVHTVAGVFAGFARTADGAVAAATSFVRSGQALIDMDPLAAEEAVRQMAAMDTVDAQVEQTLVDLRALRDRLSTGTGPIVFRQAALAFRVDAFDPDHTRIAIWNVGVLSRAGVASPQAGWAISSFDLVWERGDWHVQRESVVPGPAPALNDSTAPATAVQLTGALDGFHDYGSSQ